MKSTARGTYGKWAYVKPSSFVPGSASLVISPSVGAAILRTGQAVDYHVTVVGCQALSGRFVQLLSPCEFSGDYERCGSTNGCRRELVESGPCRNHRDAVQIEQNNELLYSSGL